MKNSALLQSFCLVILSLSTFAHLALASSATWNLNPGNGDWNTATNWTPATVPNGPTDTATFATSISSAVSVSADVEVDAVTFDTGASAFTMSVPGTPLLTISGAGVINNSGMTQNFFNVATDAGPAGEISFINGASAGTGTVFTNDASTKSPWPGAVTSFYGNATADHATFINNTGTVYGTFGGVVVFYDDSSAGYALITNNGQDLAGVIGAGTGFLDKATADHSTIICNPGGPSARGSVNFSDRSTAGDATLIAKGNTSTGGTILFLDDSKGAKARIQLSGAGTLDLHWHSTEISLGSVEGNGFVLLGDLQTCLIGANSLSTTFSGTIKHGGLNNQPGAIAKVGAGILTLTGANIYTGGTTVIEGGLFVDNKTVSATGPGPVQVNSGTLGGGGIIAGAVTMGDGIGSDAFLAPSIGQIKPAKLELQSSLTLKADATYVCRLHPSNLTSDRVTAHGVTIESGALFSFVGGGSGTIAPGTVFTVLNNNSHQPISGNFSNLADRSIFTGNGNSFQVSYEGGAGNDLTLTVVP